MQIFRIKFVHLYREITDHMATYKTPQFPFIKKYAVHHTLHKLTVQDGQSHHRPGQQSAETLCGT